MISLIIAECRGIRYGLCHGEFDLDTRLFETGDQTDKSADMKDVAPGQEMGSILGINGYNCFLVLLAVLQ